MKLCVFPLILLLAASASFASDPDEYEFDLEAVSKVMGRDISAEALKIFNDESYLGHHQYDIYVNGKFIESSAVNIEKKKGKLTAAIPRKIFDDIDLRPHAYGIIEKHQGGTIPDLPSLLPGTQVDIDPQLQSIKITLPQAFVKNTPSKISNKKIWDWGETAFFMNYSGDIKSSTTSAGRTDLGFFSLSSRLNVGKWRIYNRSTFNYDRNPLTSTYKYENLQTYATRIIPRWTARLTGGNIFTSGRFSDSLNLFGIELADDDNQRDYFDRNYIPSITGLADVPSTVTVRQDGRLIMQREVPAGPFLFDQIQGLGSGGTVEVTVQGNDGSTRIFYVPFMGNPKQLKSGRFSWNVAAGRLNFKTTKSPYVLTGGMGYGFASGMTLYGDTIFSDIYQKYKMGVAADAGSVGGLAFSLTGDRTNRDSYKHKGLTGTFEWQKIFRSTGSQVSLEYERSLAGKPSTLLQAAGLKDSDYWLGSSDILKDKTSLVVSQSVNWLKSSSVTATAIKERFKTGGGRTSLNFGLNIPMLDGTLALGLQHAKLSSSADKKASSDTTLSALLTIPFESLTGSQKRKSGTNLSLGVTQSGDQRYTRASAAGFLDKDQKVSWQLQGDRSSSGTAGAYGNLGYKADTINSSVSYSYTNKEHTFAASASGGLVAFGKGVLFSSDELRSAVVVDVPDAHGVKLADNKGGANNGDSVLVTGLNNYQRNELRLDPNSLPPWVTVNNYVDYAVPADDALIYKTFKTVSGNQVLFTVKDSDGKPIPFGATVEIHAKDSEIPDSVSDDSGLVYVQSAPPKGELVARWIDEEDFPVRCSAPYVLPSSSIKNRNDILRETLICKKQ